MRPDILPQHALAKSKANGIDKERLSHGDMFPTVFEHFREWCGEDPVFRHSAGR